MSTKQNNDFDFKRFVQLFQADRYFVGHLGRGENLDFGDIAYSINIDLHSISATLTDIDKQLKRIADKYSEETEQ